MASSLDKDCDGNSINGKNRCLFLGETRKGEGLRSPLTGLGHIPRNAPTTRAHPSQHLWVLGRHQRKYKTTNKQTKNLVFFGLSVFCLGVFHREQVHYGDIGSRYEGAGRAADALMPGWTAPPPLARTSCETKVSKTKTRAYTLTSDH